MIDQFRYVIGDVSGHHTGTWGWGVGGVPLRGDRTPPYPHLGDGQQTGAKTGHLRRAK